MSFVAVAIVVGIAVGIAILFGLSLLLGRIVAAPEHETKITMALNAALLRPRSASPDAEAYERGWHDCAESIRRWSRS